MIIIWHAVCESSSVQMRVCHDETRNERKKMNECTITHLDEYNFTKETATGTVLVDFYADWCGPCTMMQPILDQFDAEAGGRVRVAKVDTEKAPSLAARWRVQAIPLLLFLKDGEEVQRLVGVHTVQQLMESLQRVEGYQGG